MVFKPFISKETIAVNIEMILMISIKIAGINTKYFCLLTTTMMTNAKTNGAALYLIAIKISLAGLFSMTDCK